MGLINNQIILLRAIAVVSVILFHLNLISDGKWSLASGYYGVDIFFIISGFLLTGKLISQPINLIDVLGYLKMRIFRIYPALIVLVAIFVLYGFIFYTNTNLLRTKSSAFAAIMGYFNFYLLENKISYAADGSNFYIFKHLWSISIELQFYLLLPLILLISNRAAIKGVLGILIVTSFSCYCYLYRLDPNAAYLNSMARFFEPFLGALLAIVYARTGLIKGWKSKFPLVIFPLIGMLVILNLDPSSIEYIVINTLLICFCTALILFADSKFIFENHYVNRVINFLAEKSYSIYLLHFPIFILFKDLVISIENQVYRILFIAFLLAILSFFASLMRRYIEQPFIKIGKSISNLKAFIIAFVVLASIVASNYSLTQLIKNRKDVYPTILGYNLNQSEFLSDWNKHRISLRPNIFSEGGDLIRVLIVGNSHSADITHIVYANQNAFPGLLFSYLKPIGLGDENYHPECLYKLANGDESCEGIKFIQAKLLFDRADIILVAPQWYQSKYPDLEKAFKLVASKGKKIVLMGSVPQTHKLLTPFSIIPTFSHTSGMNIADAYVYQNNSLPPKDRIVSLERIQFLQATKTFDIDREVFEMAKRNGFGYMDKKSLLCRAPLDQCLVFTPDLQKIYFDYGHINIGALSYLNQRADDLKFFDYLKGNLKSPDAIFQDAYK
jgi:peptidoglycan/LPS O-acetylase OafA/YrhL